LTYSAASLEIKILGFFISLQLINTKSSHFIFRCCAPCCKKSCRDSKISASVLNVSSHEIVGKLQTIGENGLSESKLVASSENTALNCQNRVTKTVNDFKLFSVPSEH
jgi:hypothetical protein